MKKTNIMMLLGTLLSGFTLTVAAQETLPEITVTAVRYKYLSAVNQKELAAPVKMLERHAASYDVKQADFYEDDYDSYFVSFFIPEGQILAAYDKDGKLIRTAEKYKDVALPKEVRTAVTNRYPNWAIAKDVYLVNYQQQSGTTKVYKLVLQSGDKRMKVKVNEKGEVL